MGHHGIFGKGNGTYPVNMYQTSTCVPGLFACPGTIPAGRVLPNIRSHYDLYETILDFVGVDFEKTADMPGESFADELKGKSPEACHDAVVYDEYGKTRMICTRGDKGFMKLVYRGEDGPNEFYDLSSDPNERNDLIDDPAYRPMIDEMKQRLNAWFETYVNPELDGAKEDVRGKGQIDSHTFIR